MPTKKKPGFFQKLNPVSEHNPMRKVGAAGSDLFNQLLGGGKKKGGVRSASAGIKKTPAKARQAPGPYDQSAKLRKPHGGPGALPKDYRLDKGAGLGNVFTDRKRNMDRAMKDLERG